MAGKTVSPPRIEALRVRNYRALRDIEFKKLAPLTVLIGANGSGKSTVFDVFAFLSECFTEGLRRAWDRRGRFRELRSRDADGPIVIEIEYREKQASPLVIYSLEIDEGDDGPFIAREHLRWKRAPAGEQTNLLEFKNGRGHAISETPLLYDAATALPRSPERTLASPEMLAVNTLGQLREYPHATALREFVTGWHLSWELVEDMRGVPDAGPKEHLSRTGDNLANVIQYLRERHPDHLEHLIATLCRRVPCLEKVNSEVLGDGRLLLKFKDAPFDRSFAAEFVSRGTIKLLAYLTLIHDPDPMPLIGVEEPENSLYPGLQWELADGFATAAQRSQILVTTHSPYFLNPLAPEQIHVLYRAEDGFTRVSRAADIPGIPDFMEEHAILGDLWMEGYLKSGN